MSGVDPWTAFQVLRNAIGRAQRCAGKTQEAADQLEYDHYVDPAERAAVALVTRSGRRSGESWLRLRDELERLIDVLADCGIDLHVLEKALDESDGTLEPDGGPPTVAIIAFSPTHSGA